MDANAFLDIARETMWTLILVSAPVMLISLTVGLAISLFQALTQIQEMTLTFVPKILAIFVTLIVAMPFMLNQLNELTMDLFERIAGVQ